MSTAYRIKLLSVFAAFLGILLFLPAAEAQLNCNAGVEYYPDGGGIKRCNLNGHHTLYTAKGIKISCADGKALIQYPDGAVHSCSIVTAQVLDGVRCEPASKVTFGPDGRLRECKRS